MIKAKKEIVMKTGFAIVAAVSTLWAAPAAAADLPAFERGGFPITLHQLQVVGADHVLERSPDATLTLQGLPASPHQLTVLRPRAE
jgi:hypothetical protein